MAQSFNQLVSALQRRYDYYSARAVALESLEVAGLEKRASYDDKEWAKLLNATHATGDDLDRVWNALGSAPKGVKLSAAAVQDKKPAVVAAEAPEESTPSPAPAPEKPASPKKAAAKKGGAKKAASKRKR